MERQSESLINHYPIGNTVIVRKRIIIPISAFKLAKSKTDIIERWDESKSIITIVSTGELVTNIKINDNVTLKEGTHFKMLVVKDNENDLQKVFDKYVGTVKSNLLIVNETPDITLPNDVIVDLFAFIEAFNVATIVK